MVGQGQEQTTEHGEEHGNVRIPPRSLMAENQVISTQDRLTAITATKIYLRPRILSKSISLTLMAPRQNPYKRAATNMLRRRLYRDESGLVVAEETQKQEGQ